MNQQIFLTLLILFCCTTLIAQVEDPYIWLEEVEGDRALEFVNKQNKITVDKFSQQKNYQDIFARCLEIYNSNDRIASPEIYGEFIYNFWQDQDHERGIWRRTTQLNYIKGTPQWGILLDLDEMSKKDGVKWVFKHASGLPPTYDRFILSLSKGGGDAVIMREFDVKNKEFVKNGFFVRESKSDGGYFDANTLIVSTDFGKGSMTTSGYPRQIRLWQRGTSLDQAKIIFESDSSDVASSGFLMRDGSVSHLFVTRYITTFTTHTFVWRDNGLIKLDIPDDSQIFALLKNQLVLSLKSDWTFDGKTYKQGALVSLNFRDLLRGKKIGQLIFQPDEFTSITSVSRTRNNLLLNVLRNVSNELYVYSSNDGVWTARRINVPDLVTISVNVADEFTDRFFFTIENFLTPATLSLGNAQDNATAPIKSLPAYFDASKFMVTQYKAKSKDGTLVPYFVVCSRAMKYDQTNPVLLYAYGGFEVSELPNYSGTLGSAWLEKGGVYVLANIRGGGEFGPQWHQAGLKEKRQNVFDDFYAVAEDLIARKITSPKNLGVLGGSNGGLLVGVAFTQRPELYNAVFCAVPLLDMKRYNKLMAGASWMGEYGDPDKPEEWEYISRYSPYQNVKKSESYPEAFFYTSTRDDRVHPGHARKMVARMQDMGYPVYYFENTEGGHSGGSTNEQRAMVTALEYSYLLMKLKN